MPLRIPPTISSTLLMRFSYIISTFFYLGKIKLAPGTIASLATLLIWHLIIPENYFVRLLVFFFILVIGFLSINTIMPLFTEKDPQFIVVDEVVGVSIPLIFIFDNLLVAFFSFILFRILDILKPSIIYYIQHIKEPYGIMMDDILAGIITALIIINYL